MGKKQRRGSVSKRAYLFGVRGAYKNIRRVKYNKMSSGQVQTLKRDRLEKEADVGDYQHLLVINVKKAVFTDRIGGLGIARTI